VLSFVFPFMVLCVCVIVCVHVSEIVGKKRIICTLLFCLQVLSAYNTTCQHVSELFCVM